MKLLLPLEVLPSPNGMDFTISTADKHTIATVKTNEHARHLVHTANSYRGLVDVLRECYEYCQLYGEHGPDHTATIVRDLLRELGEIPPSKRANDNPKDELVKLLRHPNFFDLPQTRVIKAVADAADFIERKYVS